MFPYQTQQKLAINAVGEAWRAGRSVVPVVGAGLSADSGIPVLKPLVRYLAKLQCYVKRQVFLPPTTGKESSGLLGWLKNEAKKHEDEPQWYLERFGWPDRFQLNADLVSRIAGDPRGDESAGSQFEKALSVALTAVLKRSAGGDQWGYKSLVDGVAGLVGNVPGLKEQFPNLKKQVEDRFEYQPSGWSARWEATGSWQRLIQDTTGHRREYADALFGRLAAGRRPSQAHHYLAFLARLLGLRAVLSFNFDELIEQALVAERIDHRVFAMEDGAEFPHRALLGDALAVVKMHGSSHRLLLDERLDRPLPQEYKHHFDGVAGTNPLLLVVGWQRRRPATAGPDPARRPQSPAREGAGGRLGALRTAPARRTVRRHRARGRVDKAW